MCWINDNVVDFGKKKVVLRFFNEGIFNFFVALFHTKAAKLKNLCQVFFQEKRPDSYDTNDQYIN